MSKALTALKRPSSALLESPTGTGKTLSLLCSTLAWQRTFRAAAAEQEQFESEYKSSKLKLEFENPVGNFTETNPTSTKLIKSIVRVPQIYFASRTHTQLNQAVSELKKCPDEYINDFGGLRMTFLGSRKHSCTNKTVLNSKNIDEECRNLHLEKPGGSCPCESRAFVTKNALPHVWDMEDLVSIANSTHGCGYYAAREQQLKAHVIFCPYNYLIEPLIRKSMDINLDDSVIIFDEAHGIEDAAREAASMSIRLSMLDNVLGELEKLAPQLKSSSFSSCQKGGWSDDDDEDLMISMKKQKLDKSMDESNNKTVLEGDDISLFDDAYASCIMLSRVVNVIADWCTGVLKSPTSSTYSPACVYSGENAMIALNRLLTLDNENNHSSSTFSFMELKTCSKLQKMLTVLQSAIDDLYDDQELGGGDQNKDSPASIVSAESIRLLQQLVLVLCFLCEEGGINQSCYQVVVREEENKEKNNNSKFNPSNKGGKGKGKYRSGNGNGGGGGWKGNLSSVVEYEVCFWCLSGKVAFKSLQSECRSILLTSGTLSPLNSFASELGLTPEPVNLEAGHVVNISNQVIP